MTSVDNFKPWVWAVFAFNMLFSGIFAILSFATISNFRRVTSDTTLILPAGVDQKDWVWLFDGAAVSAFFALILVIVSVVFAIRYMVFSRRSLSHPRANFGRGVMTATSLFSAFHITNIATLFLSFTPAMNTWVGEYHANFNRVLLSATWVFGYLAAVVQLLFTIMLLRWRNREAEALDRVALSHIMTSYFPTQEGEEGLGSFEDQLDACTELPSETSPPICLQVEEHS